MKIKIFLSVILLLLVSFKSFAASDGKGEIQLSEQSVNSFINYITGKTSKKGKSLSSLPYGTSNFNKPMSFWVTIDGSTSFWWYCNHSVCMDNSVEEKKVCERQNGQSCSRFASGRYVRWVNGINPKGKLAKFSSKMTSSEVRTKLTKLGFYKNNNSSSNTTATPKITKKNEKD